MVPRQVRAGLGHQCGESLNKVLGLGLYNDYLELVVEDNGRGANGNAGESRQRLRPGGTPLELPLLIETHPQVVRQLAIVILDVRNRKIRLQDR